MRDCVPSDTMASSSATGTDLAQDRYGWRTFRAVVARQTSHSVDTQVGEDMTVTAVTTRTSQYRVIMTTQDNMRVSNITVYQ